MTGWTYRVVATGSEEFLLGVWARRRDEPVLRWAGREWVPVDEEWDAIVPRMRAWADGDIPHDALWSAAELAEALPGIPGPDERMWLSVPYVPEQARTRIRPWVSLPETDDPGIRRDETEDFIKRSSDHALMRSEAIALSSDRTCSGMAPYRSGEPERPWTRTEALQQAAWAETIAADAHRRQTDKSGQPYLLHPLRVAARFDAATQPIEHCAGWLHDVIEDSDWNAELLWDAGIRGDVIDVVLLLTRDGDPDYYERIRRDSHARAVKLADIDDNLEPARTAELDPATRERLAAKYAAARVALGDLPAE